MKLLHKKIRYSNDREFKDHLLQLKSYIVLIKIARRKIPLPNNNNNNNNNSF